MGLLPELVAPEGTYVRRAFTPRMVRHQPFAVECVHGYARMVEIRGEYLGLPVRIAPDEPEVIAETIHVPGNRCLDEPKPLRRSRSPGHQLREGIPHTPHVSRRASQ